LYLSNNFSSSNWLCSFCSRSIGFRFGISIVVCSSIRCLWPATNSARAAAAASAGFLNLQWIWYRAAASAVTLSSFSVFGFETCFSSTLATCCIRSNA
jgi:hypothetical protein